MSQLKRCVTEVNIQSQPGSAVGNLIAADGWKENSLPSDAGFLPLIVSAHEKLSSQYHQCLTAT